MDLRLDMGSQHRHGHAAWTWKENNPKRKENIKLKEKGFLDDQCGYKKMSSSKQSHLLETK
jgi:hypothetical protein